MKSSYLMTRTQRYTTSAVFIIEVSVTFKMFYPFPPIVIMLIVLKLTGDEYSNSRSSGMKPIRGGLIKTGTLRKRSRQLLLPKIQT